MKRNVMVTNIPVRKSICGYVEVEEGLSGDALNDAIAASLQEKGFEAVDEADRDADLDSNAVLSLWSFEVKTHL